MVTSFGDTDAFSLKPQQVVNEKKYCCDTNIQWKKKLKGKLQGEIEKKKFEGKLQGKIKRKN